MDWINLPGSIEPANQCKTKGCPSYDVCPSYEWCPSLNACIIRNCSPHSCGDEYWCAILIE